MLHIAMTTAARPSGVEYVRRSVESLRASGFTEPVNLFMEPDRSALDQRWLRSQSVVSHRHAVKKGCLLNWLHAADWAVCNSTAGDWLLLLQDDVIYRQDAAAVLSEFMTKAEQVGFASLYTNKAMCPKLGDQAADFWGVANFGPGRGYWGSLACCWPKASLVAALEHPRLRNPGVYQDSGVTPDKWRKIDVLTGFACYELGLPVYTHYPSLADHIGQASTIGRDKIPGIAAGRRGVDFRA